MSRSNIIKMGLFIVSFTNSALTDQSLTIIPLEKFLLQNSDVSYIPCSDQTFFEYEPFPLSINMNNHPNIGMFDKTYILKIPNAQVQSRYGFVLYKHQFIKEFIWKSITRHLQLIYNIPSSTIISVPGRVAVISQLAYFNYWHWISEVLCRLAILDMKNIEYDYLYVNQDSKFMRDSLELWGINKEKIITPTDDHFAIKADEVLVPSLVSNVDFEFAAFSCYAQPKLLKYVQKKLLTAALKYLPSVPLSKKIFISRKDSSIRNILNEDEFFQALKPYGFERYELSKLSIVDQILLFHQAEIIISPQGTGLANCIFCPPHVQLIELFQGLNDATFWYLVQDFKFNYTAVQTTQFQEDYVTAWQTPTTIPVKIIECIKQLIR